MDMQMHKIIEHDAITNTTIERDATAAELAQIKLDAEDEKARKAEAEAKAQAKAALLSKLGITAEEAALLLS